MQNIQFSENETTILGDNGSGKTTLARLLVYLDHDLKKIYSSDTLGQNHDLDVKTVGDRTLINEWRHLVLLDENALEFDLRGFRESLTNKLEFVVSNEDYSEMVREIFRRLLKFKPWKFEAHEILSPYGMAAGEKICLHLAHVFSARSALKLKLPLVFDQVFSFLDPLLFDGVSSFIKAMEDQKVYIISEPENQRLKHSVDHKLS